VVRAKTVIGEVLRAKLGGATYQPDSASAWSREIADEVKRRLKGELAHCLGRAAMDGRLGASWSASSGHIASVLQRSCG
jgi:hypothetical protein